MTERFYCLKAGDCLVGCRDNEGYCHYKKYCSSKHFIEPIEVTVVSEIEELFGGEKMVKVERRGDKAFVSHNGLTVFFNKRQNNTTGENFYTVRVTQNDGDRDNPNWTEVGGMAIGAEHFGKLAEFLSEIS